MEAHFIYQINQEYYGMEKSSLSFGMFAICKDVSVWSACFWKDNEVYIFSQYIQFREPLWPSEKPSTVLFLLFSACCTKVLCSRPSLSYGSNRLLNKLSFFLGPSYLTYQFGMCHFEAEWEYCLHSWHNFWCKVDRLH